LTRAQLDPQIPLTPRVPCRTLFRQFLLGAVTRGILASMTVPALMSH